MSIGERLGGKAIRRRRHRRVVIAAVVLLVVAAVLVFVLDSEDSQFRNEATALCQTFGERIRNEHRLSFPDGYISDEADAEYLSHAFADTMDELVVALTSLEGRDADADAAIEALGVRIGEIRSDPARFVEAGANPLSDGVAPAFDALGIPACGSELFSTSA